MLYLSTMARIAGTTSSVAKTQGRGCGSDILEKLCSFLVSMFSRLRIKESGSLRQLLILAKRWGSDV